MRIISFAVDGIHQTVLRGLFKWLPSQEADIICLQDLRCQESVLNSSPKFSLEGYSCHFLGSSLPDHHSVAIYSREMPKAIMYGFGAFNGEDANGRFIQADFERTTICSLLAPHVNSNGSIHTSAHEILSEQKVKDRFFQDLKNYLHKISRKRRNYIICGNWNIAHRAIDISSSGQHEDLPGCLPHEQEYLDQLYQGTEYLDAFRQYNTEHDEFSYWPSGKPNNGPGFRNDLQVISNSLKEKVEYATIYKSQSFSSHAPIIIDYDLENL